MVRHTGEYFINEEGIAIASVPAFQSACIDGAEFNTPEADGLAADSDASLSEQVFDIAMTQIESVVEPDSVANDI